MKRILSNIYKVIIFLAIYICLYALIGTFLNFMYSCFPIPTVICTIIGTLVITYYLITDEKPFV